MHNESSTCRRSRACKGYIFPLRSTVLTATEHGEMAVCRIGVMARGHQECRVVVSRSGRSATAAWPWKSQAFAPIRGLQALRPPPQNTFSKNLPPVFLLKTVFRLRVQS